MIKVPLDTHGCESMIFWIWIPSYSFIVTSNYKLNDLDQTRKIKQ